MSNSSTLVAVKQMLDTALAQLDAIAATAPPRERRSVLNALSHVQHGRDLLDDGEPSDT